MGFYCTHAYAHSNQDHAKRIPFALKGVDMIVYAVFASLGLRGKVRPVLARFYHSPEGLKSDSEDEAGNEPSDGSEEGDDGKEADSDKPKRLIPNHLCPTMVTAWGRSYGEARAWEVSPRSAKPRYKCSLVCCEQIARSAWPCEIRRDLHWLNEPGPEQLALVHLTVRIRDLHSSGLLFFGIAVRKRDVHGMEVFGGSHPYRCSCFCSERLRIRRRRGETSKA